MSYKCGYPRLVLAGTHSGVGKTTVMIGLLAALKRRGIAVQPYKIGPDYIDPGFHSQVTGRACRNLDSFFFSKDTLLELFSRQDGEVSLIEGVMGMYDGLGVDSGIGSTAHVAKILKAPVILIIDAGKMAASAAAMALGYKNYDRNVYIGGCILNRIAGETHYQIIRRAIEKKAKIKVLGYLPKRLDFSLPERHLGLTPAQEIKAGKMYLKLAHIVEQYIDVDTVIEISKKAPALPSFRPVIFNQPRIEHNISIAVAKDKCFHFYYQDNLDILRHYGARLCFFSPLKSKCLPKGVCGVYIGGGFPELFAGKLAKNISLRKDIKAKSLRGMPIYAECGGLMYVMKELQTADKKKYPMVGIFSGKTRMGKGLRMFGYYNVESITDNILSKKNSLTKGHVFHWSYVTIIPKKTPRALKIQRKGVISYDGYMKNKSMASYTHLHFGCNPDWAKNFVDECILYQRKENNEK